MSDLCLCPCGAINSLSKLRIFGRCRICKADYPFRRQKAQEQKPVQEEEKA